MRQVSASSATPAAVADASVSQDGSPLHEAAAADRASARSHKLIPAILAASDSIAIAVAFGLAIAIVGPPAGDRTTLAVVFLCMIPVWLVAINSAGLYERDLRLINHTTADEVVDLARIAALCTSAVLVVIWAADADAVDVGLMLVFWVTATAALVIFRAIARLAWRYLNIHLQRTRHRRGRDGRPTPRREASLPPGVSPYVSRVHRRGAEGQARRARTAHRARLAERSSAPDSGAGNRASHRRFLERVIRADGRDHSPLEGLPHLRRHRRRACSTSSRPGSPTTRSREFP